MPYAERTGYRIHYETLGRENAPPLLLVMGLALASDAWESLPRVLAERFRVIVLDNRGVGGSSAPSRGFRIRDMADDAAAVLDAAGAGPAAVFGISMGGMIAQELTIRYPERVRSLVLGATFGSHRRSRKPSPSVARDLFLVGFMARRGRPLARLLVSDDFMSVNEERLQRWMAGLSHTRRSIARRQLLAIALHEAEEGLGRLRTPTLVISGDRDRLVPVENSRRLARIIPRARLVELPGAGHAFPFERPVETIRAVTEHCLPPAA
jgi:pimeloyl-ACP methyl ester carboxylesterase